MISWATDDWTPDAPDYKSPMAVAKGCYPAADGSDRPLLAPTVQSAALSSQCLGAVNVLDRNAASYTFAGTIHDLWIAPSAGSQSWINATKTAAGTYNVTPGRHWRFAQFGEKMVAVNGELADAMQAGDLPVARFADLAANAPKARYVASIEPGFLMAGYITGQGANAGIGTLGGGVGWCGLNDATVWPAWGTLAAASVQSDFQQLLGGGNVTGILPAIGGSQGLVLTERAEYRIDYTGPPGIFAFREIDQSRGSICPNGSVAVGPLAFYISEDGFMRSDAATPQPFGFGRVDRTFMAEVDRANLERVYAAVDFNRQIIVWSYPISGTGGTPARWLIYSWAKDRWRYCDDPAIAAELLMAGARSAGYTMDTLDTLFPGGMETATVSMDDQALAGGGTRTLAGFDSQHRLVFYSGATLQAILESGESDGDNGARTWISGTRPLTDSAKLSVSIGSRGRFGEPLTYSPPTGLGVDRTCPHRVSGRYSRARVTIPAGDVWSYFSGGQVFVRSEGRR
jgi:hypothetical protein